MIAVSETPIRGAYILEVAAHGDARGVFRETFSRRAWLAAGLPDVSFVQDNEAISAPKGVLRGLHFQEAPHAQGKLVRVGAGAIFDVIVDLRRGSPSFGRWFGCELSAANARQLWAPAGLAHGYLTLAPDTAVLYKTTDFYAAASARGVAWNDPALGVEWPLDAGQAPILSHADTRWPRIESLDALTQ